MIVLGYVLLAFSFTCIYFVTKQGRKSIRYLALSIYLVTAVSYTFLVITKVNSPTEDANIGLGLSLFLEEFVSIAGIIISVLIDTGRRRKSH